MPKKTREEKMAAQLRRMKKQMELQTEGRFERPLDVAEAPTKQNTPQSSFSLKDLDSAKAKADQPAKTKTQGYHYTPIDKVSQGAVTHDYNQVKSDLRRILILAVATVALEIVLNLTLRASFAKLILLHFGIEI